VKKNDLIKKVTCKGVQVKKRTMGDLGKNSKKGGNSSKKALLVGKAKKVQVSKSLFVNELE